jgi:uncharacterized membrane protein
VSELVVSLFRDQQRAPEVLNELRRRECQWAEELNRALVLTLDVDGQVKAEISLDPTGCEPNSWIKLWSSLLGGALFIHGAHVLVEAAESLVCPTMVDCHSTRSQTSGQELKWWRDSVRLSDDFRRDLAAALSTGGSAIFILFQSDRATDVLPHLRTFGDTIVHTALTPDQDEELAKLIGVLDQQTPQSLATQIP